MRTSGFLFGIVLGVVIVVGIAALGFWFVVGLVVGSATTLAGLVWLARVQRDQADKAEAPCPE